MGKTYSTEKKTEEIIIAQNGANDATNSHFEQQVEKYGMAMSAVTILIIIAILYLVYKKCIQRARKVIRKEMAAAHNNQISPQQLQQALPRQMV